MARTTRSAATERAYLHFAPSTHGGVVVPIPASAAGAGEEFDESDIWGAFAPSAAPVEPPPPRGRPLPAAATRKAAKATKPLLAGLAGGGRAPHGSLPVNIPDWSKILGDEYHRSHHHHAAAGDWEVDDGDDEDAADAVVVIPPHELAWRRRAASMSAHEGAGGGGALGRTLKVRDAVWKRTTGFQD